MAIPISYSLPPMPEGLEALTELALDLRWSWNHAADRLWQYIDPGLWEITGNPWLILQTVATTRLKILASDPAFQKLLDDVLAEHREALESTAWFQQAYPKSPLSVAYFCMEFGLSEALPIYSGGLGILAGDYLKTASDLGVPVVGIGLLYQQGYFRQVLNKRGEQTEYYPYNDPSQLPILPVREHSGEWLRVTIDFPGRRLWLRVWEASVGRAKLYLLDSNDPVNSPADRGITSQLYSGGPELRLQQEIVLGIGGWRVLRALGIEVNICHLNEGHAVLAVIERARAFMDSSGQSFRVALAATRAGNIFTTHTPAEAGFDRFPPEMIGHYLGSYADQIGIGLDGLLALGRSDPADKQEPFSMAYLAVRGAGTVNAVSRLHREVSRRIFQPLFPRWPQREVPVTYVTNGIHVPSWDSAAADKLWSDACGKRRWLGTMDTIIDDLKKVPDEIIWNFRMAETERLINYARERLAWQLTAAGASEQDIDQVKQLLDPNVLTMGFARRFTGYKRPNLLLHDPDRLARILSHPQRPVQLVIAGKAHPHDEWGKAMIQAWSEFIRRPEVLPHVVFIADYDMVTAERLVQGVDLWINTPRRPWEACGTSGMKVLVNGGLNCSEKEGWWAEAYQPEVGWAIGDGQEHYEPGWDAVEANQLYELLEKEIIPEFYNRNEHGVPVGWVARMRASMAMLAPRFSSNRMLREYVENIYIPAANRFRQRVDYGARLAKEICTRQTMVKQHWHHLRFGEVEVHMEDNLWKFEVPVYFGELDPAFVSVQLYADPLDGQEPIRIQMVRGKKIQGVLNGYIYQGETESTRAAEHFTPRIISAHPAVSIPLEDSHILWQK
jgi:starch phosphorylase